MARIRSCIALAVVLAVFAAAPAGARTTLGDLSWEVAESPDAAAFTPDSIVYGLTGDHRPFGIYEQRAGQGPRRLRQFDSLRGLRYPEPADAQIRAIAVGASRELIAAAVSTSGYSADLEDEWEFPGQAALLVAPRDGRATRLLRCPENDIGPVRVDGFTVAYLGAGCDNRRRPIAVRDMRGGARTIHPPAGGRFDELRLAGRFVAAAVVGGRSNRAVIVYDWRRGREVYRARGDRFALQRDGKLAVLAGRGEPGCAAHDVRWFSPDGPAHLLRGAACGPHVLIAGNRVLSTRYTGPLGDRSGAAQSEAVVVGLASGAARSLFPTFVSPEFARAAVYFDGARVGYGTPRCDSTTLRVAVDTLAELVRDGPLPPESCRVSFSRVAPEMRVNRDGDLRLELGCRAGCRGSIELWDPAEDRAIFQYSSLGAAPGEFAPVWVSIDPGFIRRRGGRLELELRVTTRQPTGGTATQTRPLAVLPPA